MKDIERTEFLNKLKTYKDKQVIKVITCSKSGSRIGGICSFSLG